MSKKKQKVAFIISKTIISNTKTIISNTKIEETGITGTKCDISFD